MSGSHETMARRKPGLLAWLALAPLVLWLLAFVVAPTAILGVYSFCQRDELGQIVFDFTWENYARVLDPLYLRILARSVIYAGLTTLVCLAAGYPVAWFIGRAPVRWRALLLILVMIPFWTSFLVRTYAWIVILSQNGLLNGLAQYARVISEPWEMLYTPGAVVLGLIYAYLPFMILPLYGSVEKLDGALVEAAMDLGARPLAVLRQVVVPLTMPGILAGALLVFIPATGMFAIAQLMGGGREPTIGEVIQDQFLAARDWPFGAALGMTLLLLFVLCFVLWGRRQSAGRLIG